MSKVQVDTIDTRSGTSTMQIGSTNTSTINIGVSGDTVNIPSGVTIANAGTATGFGGDNTPSFLATVSSTRSIADSTDVTLLYNTEVFDTDGCFDTSTGKFTPTTAGKYFLFTSMRWDTDVNFNISYLKLFKNTTLTGMDGFPNDYYNFYYTGTIVEANGSSDYFLTKGQQNSGGAKNLSDAPSGNFFGGYKIIT